MKKLLLLLALAYSISVNAQDDKTVTLTVSGQGKTQDEAKQVALRSAIEQAFGTFISSKTEILNDKLVKDEIVSVTNGNIQKFDVLSEVQIPDGGYATTLKAIVSVTKLTSFVESKGVVVDLNGAAFAMNIKLQKLNEEAEFKAILNLCQVSKDILSKSLDYTLDISEPISYKGSNDNFSVGFAVNCKTNKNFSLFHEYFWKTISSIAMTNEETENYKKLQKTINILIKYESEEYFNLRNSKSLLAIKNLMIKSNENLLNFRILSEVDTIYVKKCCHTDTYRSNFYSKMSDYEFIQYPDIWSLDFGSGFPSAARFSATNGVRKLLPGYLEGTGSMYYDLLKSTSKPGVLNKNGNYFTTSYRNDFEKYDNNEGGAGYWKGWLEEEPRLIMDLIIYANGSNLFKFKYNHILSLSKLEKISKYKIEPWENK